MLVEGVVERTSEKPGKFGTMYSVKLRNSDTWYGLKGAKYQPFKNGQKVEFDAAQNQRGYWDADSKSVRVLEDVVAEAPAAAAVGRSNYISKDDYWSRKEERDLKNDHLRNVGAARNTAIAFVDLLAKYEAVKLPAKQAEREAALLEAVETYKEEFMKGVESEPAEAVATTTATTTNEWA